MPDKKDLKTKIWVYAVVLFTSAFIVLLITAYVQIKQQKNIDSYKTQISVQESEKKNIQISYANAQEMISELSDKNEKLVSENENISETADKLTNELEAIKEKSKKLQLQYEKFTEAQAEYIKGNVAASAQLLKSIDVKEFSGKSLEAYNILSEKAYSEAGKKMYDEGYKLYQLSKYSEAIERLSLSRDIIKTESYSDNCLYYLAYAEYRVGNKENGVELMKILIKDYPDSSFIKYARKFINKYE